MQNATPWRYYNGAKSHTLRQRERLAFNEFSDRSSLLEPPLKAADIAICIGIAVAGIATFTLIGRAIWIWLAR